MKTLSDGDHRRLVGLVNMTSSQHDGEALNALRIATKIAASAGLLLSEALRLGASAEIDLARITRLETDAFERGRQDGIAEERRREKRARRQESLPTVVQTAPAPQAFTWHDMRQVCLANPDVLSDRELEFVTSLARWRGTLTSRQSDWLFAIYSRVAAIP
jgi:hypothetical protein